MRRTRIIVCGLGPKALALAIKRGQRIELRLVTTQHAQLCLDLLSSDRMLDYFTSLFDKLLVHSAAGGISMIEGRLPHRQRKGTPKLRRQKAHRVMIGMAAFICERQKTL